MLDDLHGGAPEWQEQALCAQTDPEAFFPEKGGSTREAKKICERCPVRADCLEYALDHDERFGIWGGLSERERRRVKRRTVDGRVTSAQVLKVLEHGVDAGDDTVEDEEDEEAELARV